MRKKTHPYVEFEGSDLWKIVEKTIDDLIENQDIKQNTVKEYIVGYIVKTIHENKNTILK